MLIINCEQRSEFWYKLKLGIPSASNASRIITNNGEPSKQRDGYLYELVAERLSHKNTEVYENENILMGLERESESRQYYELVKRVKVRQVGIIYKDKDKKFLCSPDGIVQNRYGLELKNVLPKTQVKYLLDNKLPCEYFSQIQFSLYVTGFNFWDFCSYVPNMHPLIIRVRRDRKFIAKLEVELKKFCSQLKTIVRKIK